MHKEREREVRETAGDPIWSTSILFRSVAVFPSKCVSSTPCWVARVKTNVERSCDSLLCDIYVYVCVVGSRVLLAYFCFANLLYEVAAVRRECVKLLLVAWNRKVEPVRFCWTWVWWGNIEQKTKKWKGHKEKVLTNTNHKKVTHPSNAHTNTHLNNHP